MTNEIQVGEYVRTKYGNIGKVENINDFRPPEYKYAVDIQAKDLVFIGEEQIAKHSSNIIDLIKAGDYVNGGYVDDVADGFVIFYDGCGEILMTEQNIKTIVTKEQFKAMEYKVGGE